MIRQSITPQQVADFLNELVAIDPQAMYDLVEQRVRCNQALAEHETVQVQSYPDAHEVGMLGVLNGLLGTFDDGPWKNWGCLSAELALRTDEPPYIRFFIRENT